MKTIKLLGDIAEQFKPEWHLHVDTPAEALRAIDANRPGFVQACDAGDYIAILVDDTKGEAWQINPDNALTEWHDETLFLVPRIGGEIGAAAAAAMGFVTAAGALTTTGLIVAAVINIALAVAISAIAQLIAGSPKSQSVSETETPESKPSYLFNGAVNTTRQGHRIPVLYGGPMLVGSMVLSAQIITKDIPV